MAADRVGHGAESLGPLEIALKKQHGSEAIECVRVRRVDLERLEEAVLGQPEQIVVRSTAALNVPPTPNHLRILGVICSPGPQQDHCLTGRDPVLQFMAVPHIHRP